MMRKKLTPEERRRKEAVRALVQRERAVARIRKPAGRRMGSRRAVVVGRRSAGAAKAGDNIATRPAGNAPIDGERLPPPETMPRDGGMPVSHFLFYLVLFLLAFGCWWLLLSLA